MFWVAGLLPLGLLGMKRRRLRCIGAMATMVCLMTLAGCGAPRLIPSTSSGGGGGGTTATPTPSGTYNLVITGISTGLTRSVGLTLVVQ
jgi:hypothetical protein